MECIILKVGVSYGWQSIYKRRLIHSVVLTIMGNLLPLLNSLIANVLKCKFQKQNLNAYALLCVP